MLLTKGLQEGASWENDVCRGCCVWPSPIPLPLLVEVYSNYPVPLLVTGSGMAGDETRDAVMSGGWGYLGRGFLVLWKDGFSFSPWPCHIWRCCLGVLLPSCCEPEGEASPGNSRAEGWKDLGPWWHCWTARSTNPDTLTCGSQFYTKVNFLIVYVSGGRGFVPCSQSIQTDIEGKYRQFPNISAFGVYLVQCYNFME